MKKPKLYIVEGAHDLNKLKLVDNNINVMFTSGIRVKKEFIERVKTLEKKYEIVLLLDPDYAGDQIRKKLTSNLNNPTNIYLPKDKTLSKNNDVGVEHASIEFLRKIIEKRNKTPIASDIDEEYLIEKGYLNNTYSRRKRKDLLNHLNIGYTNGKGLLERLLLYGIKRSEIDIYEKEKEIRSKFP